MRLRFIAIFVLSFFATVEVGLPLVWASVPKPASEAGCSCIKLKKSCHCPDHQHAEQDGHAKQHDHHQHMSHENHGDHGPKEKKKFSCHSSKKSLKSALNVGSCSPSSDPEIHFFHRDVVIPTEVTTYIPTIHSIGYTLNSYYAIKRQEPPLQRPPKS